MKRSRVNLGLWNIEETNSELFADLIIEMAIQRIKAKICTPNLQHISLCVKKPSLYEIMTSFDVQLPDGWPVALAASIKSGRKVKRTTGSDVFLSLMAKIKEFPEVAMYVFGNHGEQISTVQISSNIHILQPPIDADVEILREFINRELQSTKKEGVLVLCLGFPKQEILAQSISSNFDGPILCFGSAWDFYIGNVMRAPKYIRVIGFEWLWRLLGDPSRLWRRYILDSWQGLRWLFVESIRRR